MTSHNPDLVILDLGLPDGDGIALTPRLREWSELPIVVMVEVAGEGASPGEAQ